MLARARALSDAAAGIVLGDGVEEAAREAAARSGARVLLADDAALGDGSPRPRIEVLARLVATAGYDTVLLATTTSATDVAAGLSARLEAGLNWDLLDLERDGAELVGVRRALQDTVSVRVGWRGSPRLALLRPGAHQPVAAATAGAVERLEVTIESPEPSVTVLERGTEQAPGPSLAEAGIIVAGGRGVGSRQGFAALEELAEELGGIVGVSLPIVEIGWYPASRQVGQSGRIVAPAVYLACGISGAIQHRIGMERSATVVAINSDPAAAIFELADLGVVGDLHEIVPHLTRLVRARRAGAPSA